MLLGTVLCCCRVCLENIALSKPHEAYYSNRTKATDCWIKSHPGKETCLLSSWIEFHQRMQPLTTKCRLEFVRCLAEQCVRWEPIRTCRTSISWGHIEEQLFVGSWPEALACLLGEYRISPSSLLSVYCKLPQSLCFPYQILEAEIQKQKSTSKHLRFIWVKKTHIQLYTYISNSSDDMQTQNLSQHFSEKLSSHYKTNSYDC